MTLSEDLSLSVISLDESSLLQDQIESLNLNIAEKNKLIQEQENKISRLDNLVEQLLFQIQMYKVQEKRFHHEKSRSMEQIRGLQEENKDVKSKSRIYKAALIKLSNKKPNQTKVQDKIYVHPNKRQKICFQYEEHGYCRRNEKCPFSHRNKNVNLSPDYFLGIPPLPPARRKWLPPSAPAESWRQKGQSHQQSPLPHMSSPPFPPPHLPPSSQLINQRCLSERQRVNSRKENRRRLGGRRNPSSQ